MKRPALRFYKLRSGALVAVGGWGAGLSSLERGPAFHLESVAALVARIPGAPSSVALERVHLGAFEGAERLGARRVPKVWRCAFESASSALRLEGSSGAPRSRPRRL